MTQHRLHHSLWAAAQDVSNHVHVQLCLPLVKLSTSKIIVPLKLPSMLSFDYITLAFTRATSCQ